MKSKSFLISDLENLIADRIALKIEKWNLYLGDAGLARKLAFECIRHLDLGSKEAVQISLKNILVGIGDGKEKIELSKFISSAQVIDLEEILSDLD